MNNITLRSKLKILDTEVKRRKREGGDWYILEKTLKNFEEIIKTLETKQKYNDTKLNRNQLNHLNLIIKIIKAIPHPYSGIDVKGSKLNRTDINKYHH